MNKYRHCLMVAVLAAGGLAGAAGALAAPGDPHRVGYISDITGPVQGTFKYTYEGFKLYFDTLNAEGGIKGRKVEVLLKDVQSETQKSVNAVHELKASGVSGIAGLAVSSTHAATLQAAAKAEIPVVVGFPPNLPVVLEPADKWSFGVGQVFNVTNTITGNIARDLSKDGKRFACVAFEAPASILSCKVSVESAKKAGFDAAEVFVVPQNQRDFRAVAQNIAKFNPDLITDCFGQSHFIGLIPALGQVGYKGIYLNLETGINDPVKRDVLKSAPDLRFYTYSRFVAGKNIERDGAQARKLQAAAKKAGIDEVVAAHSAGWVLGQVVAQAFEKVDADTPEAFRKALTTTDLDAGGLTGARVKFTEADHYGPTSYRLYRYDRATTEFIPIGDWYQLAPGKRS